MIRKSKHKETKSKKEEKNGVTLENKFYSLREIISFEKKFLSDKIFLLSS